MQAYEASGNVKSSRILRLDVGFAGGVIFMLMILFLPLPPFLIDVGLAFSITFAILILMVALWIEKPLDFSAFPTILLIATMLRLSLNIATTRLILSEGDNGPDAAGQVIFGFSNFIMAGDFVIGTIVFLILVIVNFMVITKGATRIAEVGARFTLDAIPGKQMAIDADLSSGTIDENEAARRRRELEEESAFYGAMDGASKFVRGDAIAGLIITAVNIFGGIIIGTLSHGMSPATAASVFTKLSVGDGLVSQIPALVVSLAAGLLVAKGGTRGSTDRAVFGQLGGYPRAMLVAAVVLVLLALAPGLPFLPFVLFGLLLVVLAFTISSAREKEAAEKKVAEETKETSNKETQKGGFKQTLQIPEIELCIGMQLSSAFLPQHEEFALRVSRMRKKFAKEYGLVIPDIKMSDDLSIGAKAYEIKLHGTTVASGELRIGDVLVITGNGPVPDVLGDEVREPAFGMKAVWISEMFKENLKQGGFTPIDCGSVCLTHLGEVIRNNLAQLLSYKDARFLLDQLDVDYRRLLDELVPSQISYSGLQGILKSLLAERVSIRNIQLILEAVAEIVPQVQRSEQIVEHVRARLSQQICGDISDAGVLKLIRLGPKWDGAFSRGLKKDGRGEVIEFDIEPSEIEVFGDEAAKTIGQYMDAGERCAVLTTPDARPFVRMIIERLFPTMPVLSHTEIARGFPVKTLGAIS